MLTDLVDLVLPRYCVACEAPGAAVCPACAFASPIRRDVAGVPVTAAGEYADRLRTALLHYKERGRRDLARPLGALLAEAVQGAGVLVPVPSARRAARERGGDHVLRLARRVRRRTGLPVVRALRFVREPPDSAGLNIRQRQENLSGSMAALPPPCGLPAIVVDDIVTTGATLREAVRALRAAGWTVGGAAVVAATPRRRPP